MNNCYIEDGLLKFTNLKNDSFQIVTTFDNKLWGNMNPYFANSEEDKQLIKENDDKICELLNSNLTFVLTTPPENTICNLNFPSFQLLSEINKVDQNTNKFISIRANSIIYSKNSRRTSFAVAPADCPIVVITNKKRDFVIIMHMGFPQYVQNLHNDTLILSSEQLNLSDEIEIYITPYICSNHYLIRNDKYQMTLDKIGNKLKTYSEKVYSEIYKEDCYSIDINKIIAEEILNRFPKANVYQTGICTYEEAGKGNLFSHKYITDQKQLGNILNEGQFNVIVSL